MSDVAHREFVMLPVPEELTEDTKMFLMGLDMRSQSTKTEHVDPDAVDRLLATLNPRSRTALNLLADASAAGDHLSISDLAARAGWTVHDASGVLTELSALVWSAVGRMMGTVVKEAADVAAGTIDWNDWVVVVWKDLALAVLAAEARAAEG